MAGKETILIGETTPFAMTVSETIATDIFSQGMTIGKMLHRRKRRKTTNIDWRSQLGSEFIIRVGDTNYKKTYHFIFYDENYFMAGGFVGTGLNMARSRKRGRC